MEAARKLPILLATKLVVASLCCPCAFPGRAAAQTPAREAIVPVAVFAPDHILVQPRRDVSAARLSTFHQSQGARVLRTLPASGGLQIVAVPAGETVAGLIARYRASGLVEFAEPDYVMQLAATPDDPKFVDGTLWGLNKIQAPVAWDVRSTASNVIVAVLDSGVRATHEDLAANLWVSPQDGGHGFNAYTGGSDASDDSGHGTLMAGVLGAVGNNARGVVGVAWRVQILSAKCFNSAGNGTNSDIIACMDFARTHGARVMNASWSAVGSPFSQAMYDAIQRAGDDGVILVTACGNNFPNVNIDVTPCYPANYDLDNIVAVAYTTATDAPGFLSNYGATNVDLAAPGDQIVSTYHTADDAYLQPTGFGVAGTSFAAAFVSGALALMIAEFPHEPHPQLTRRLLAATDPLPVLTGKCRSGGRLNLRKAITPIQISVSPSSSNSPVQLRVTAATNLTCVVQYSTHLAQWLPFATNTTSNLGFFEVGDPQSTHVPLRFYRAVTGL